MPRAKLTAIVPVLNEEANIEDCLSRLTFADEILVVDSGSTDRTLDIARNFQARIIHRDYNYSASQKNWAIPQAKHEWVLVCDADERVTDQLREEIEAVLSTDSKYVGYSIPRATYFLGRRIRHCGWSPQRDRNVRLFLRDKGRYQDRQVHADVVCQGPVGRLNSPLVHYSFKTFEQYITKMNRYTTWAAKDIFDAGRNMPGPPQHSSGCICFRQALWMVPRAFCSAPPPPLTRSSNMQRPGTSCDKPKSTPVPIYDNPSHDHWTLYLSCILTRPVGSAAASGSCSTCVADCHKAGTASA